MSDNMHTPSYNLSNLNEQLSQQSDTDTFNKDDFLICFGKNQDLVQQRTVEFENKNDKLDLFDDADSFDNDDFLESFHEEKDSDKENLHDELQGIKPIKVDFTTANGQPLEIRSQKAINYVMELAKTWANESNKSCEDGNDSSSFDEKEGSFTNSFNDSNLDESKNDIKGHDPFPEFIPLAKNSDDEKDLFEQPEYMLKKSSEIKHLSLSLANSLIDIPSPYATDSPQSAWSCSTTSTDGSPIEKRTKFEKPSPS